MTDQLRHGRFGYHAYHRHLPAEMRLKVPCANCPFTTDFHLAPKRLEGIKFSLSMGQPFWCHKTVYQRGVPHDDELGAPSYHRLYRMCEGAAQWLDGRMAMDGIDKLGELLGVSRQAVQSWLHERHIPLAPAKALLDHPEPYWLGHDTRGFVDLVVRCHLPRMLVVIDPKFGPRQLVQIDRAGPATGNALMREVHSLIRHQWQPPPPVQRVLSQ